MAEWINGEKGKAIGYRPKAKGTINSGMQNEE
jgi:hypothetical protein